MEWLPLSNVMHARNRYSLPQKIREWARAILDEKPGERDAVLKRYQAALSANGDSARGKRVFQETCAKCHKLDGIGAEVGPDLGTVRNRPGSVLLGDILIPSKSIAQNYEAYVVERVSGGMSEGVVGSQTPTSLTLRQEEGKEIVIPRSDIKRMYASNLSAMPEVAGDAALLVDPTSVEQIANAFQTLISNSALRDELARRGLARAGEFAWETAAEQTWAVYQGLL